MELLECGHVAAAGKPRLCGHLLVEEPPSHYRVLTGVRVRFDLACEDCADSPVLLTACEGCVDRACEYGWSDVLGWKGTPEVLHEDRELQGVRSQVCDVRMLNDRCLAPLPDGWLAFTAAGLVTLSGGVAHEVKLVDEDHGKALPALHTSPDGRHAAVVLDYGRKGVVVDLRSGAVVVELDRGRYHSDTTPFPVAFLPGGRVVAGSDWNRLSVFDLATGALLWQEDTGGHNFHGRLTVSPTGRWVLDDSWFWHPLGIPQVYDADFQRVVALADRAYAWDQPVAWVSPDVVAIQRIGADDEAMLDGVELYEVPSGRALEPFAGPVGRMWGRAGLLYVSGEAGLEVWEPSRGARIVLVPGFRPVAHHDGTFVELRDGQLYSFSVD
ncbi:MAG: hypothetical protein QOF58_2341 [Pseudonocardiales bacterium]|nr:hypothetical protein [Pseudonocardiales bacterium]